MLGAELWRDRPRTYAEKPKPDPISERRRPPWLLLLEQVDPPRLQYSPFPPSSLGRTDLAAAWLLGILKSKPKAGKKPYFKIVMSLHRHRPVSRRIKLVGQMRQSHSHWSGDLWWYLVGIDRDEVGTGQAVGEAVDKGRQVGVEETGRRLCSSAGRNPCASACLPSRTDSIPIGHTDHVVTDRDTSDEHIDRGPRCPLGDSWLLLEICANPTRHFLDAAWFTSEPRSRAWVLG